MGMVKIISKFNIKNKDGHPLTWAEARAQGRTREWFKNAVVDSVRTICFILIISCLVKMFLIKGWFHIPSGSMEGTLQVNDKVLVNVAGTYIQGIKRGDVVVFKDSQGWMPKKEHEINPINDGLVFLNILPDTSVNYIVKRVIGLPGDTVESDGEGKIRVNGVEITEPYVSADSKPSRISFKVTVPDGKYFMMGDHRNNSADSRFHISDGKTFIPREDIIGSVFVVVYPSDHFKFLDGDHKVFHDVPEPVIQR